jgi:glycopeptide antibiotics resistance protein
LKINRTWVKWISRVLFILYIILLSYFLFFSERYGRTAGLDYRYNLTLLKEVKRFIKYRHELGLESFIVNIFGNVIAFMPFGFVLPIISPENRKLFYIVLLSLEFSISIELIQLIFKVGIFDVDDILMNTFGGILGGILFFICYFIYRKFLNKKID